MTLTASCPALFITAPSSNSGKTTVVAAMARYWSNQGKRVRVFKTGPDFIDPIFHELASGEPAYQLDLGMMGEAICKQHLYLAAQQADLILIEGVMGMYDGANNSANLAATFGVPLLAVIPASSMAQTFGAIAYGLAHYQDNVNLFGVIANYVGSPSHAQMLRDSLPAGIEFCGALPRDNGIALPERHLGLVQAQEIEGIDQWLDYAASVLGDSCQLSLPAAIFFEASNSSLFNEQSNVFGIRPLQGQTIAVAQDCAFSFIYRDNICLLQKLGAQIRYFSPINDHRLPIADSLYLPGGYPELHLSALAANQPMLSAIKQHIESGKPTLAECGGMLYLLQQLTTKTGQKAELVGAIAGHGVMQTKLQGLGMLSATLGGHQITGHCFHYSTANISLAVIATAAQAGKTHMQEKVYFHKNTLASYVHWYLPSTPELTCDLFLGRLAMKIDQ
ncbi:cobyrinate a,c-diamide synthase [Photobacterium carnosum]|nr:cobyrinate a,c-diamide synthase [Photobacterium carnosum]